MLGRGFLILLLLVQAQDPPKATVAAWDTVVSLPDPLKTEDLSRKEGWKRVAAGDVPAGDAVITNGRLLATARKKFHGVELYSLGFGTPVSRGLLSPVGGGEIQRVTVSEAARGAVALEVAWKETTIRFRLPKGEPFIETQALSDGVSLRMESPSRFALLPDFFADDLLFDARRFPQDQLELPSENFLLQFAGKGDAILMNVFENRDQEVRVLLSGKDGDRWFWGSETGYGKAGRKIWVAVLEGPGRWHSIDVKPADAKKVLPLDWIMPFIAQWRADFTRADGLTDSWDLLLPDKDGDGYIKPSWLAQDGKISEASRTSTTGEVDRDAYKVGGPASDRLGPDRKRWTTVLGRFEYPCWTDRERKGWLQPIQHKKLAFDGPVVIYAGNRLAETPVEEYTAADVVRATLGVGPCQYILDVEGQKQEHVGRATCHVRTCLTETWTAGRQKEKRKEVEAWVKDARDFVAHIRNRVNAYVAFGKETREYLDGQKKARPELAGPIDDLIALAHEFDARVEERLQAIRVHKALKSAHAALEERKEEPTTPALVEELNRYFLKTFLDYEGADWKDRFKREYTDPLTAIGGQQDEMVGECRWVAKALRQKAGLAAALDPRMAAIAAEVRARTQKILRGGAAYEGARH